MHFEPFQIDPVLSSFADFLPSFSEVLSLVLSQPKLPPLQESDFANLSVAFNKDKLEPNELQQKILNHLFTLQPPFSCLLVLATGLGKTYLSAFAVQKYFNEDETVLFVVNSVFIRDQAHERFQHLFQNVKMLNFKDQGSVYEGQQFVFCLYQSLQNFSQALISKISILIIDEVHHVLAPTYLSKVKQFKHLKIKIGLTATLTHQNDITGDKIKQLFENNVICNLPWTIAKKLQLFPKVHYFEFSALGFTINFNSEYEDLKKQIIEGNQIQKLNKNQNLSVQEMAQNFAVFNVYFQTKKTIIFLSSVREVQIFINEFESKCDLLQLMPAHYQIEKSILNTTINQFSSYTGQCALVTVGMATEGYDLQDIDCVLMGRQTDSERLFVQQMGRGLRKQGDKECYVLDMCYNLRSRWIRLEQEESRSNVLQYMQEFWEVRGIE
ncbi:Helicase-related_protein [Hexamita inflata]|uniref:Helicase-related protein n=1 Tax=Hexamita inflata TaxID=28002 RepID=A0AA86NAA1_9EUKA|nr:Helicase-related protein [Hexamita inflata]